MRIISDPFAWAQAMEEASRSGSIGFVPTMGALHAGHTSLMSRAKEENSMLAVSIFVNPAQFNDPKDLAAYPEPREGDLRILDHIGADFVFTPTMDAMYPDDYTYRLTEAPNSSRFCGASRPGHFDGVLTVVMKLLQLTQADRAYFGEKDWQQFLLIHGMARAFFLRTRIIPCPLIREASGLALSSRNLLLTEEERAIAPQFSAALRRIAKGEDPVIVRKDLETAGFRIDYIEVMRNETFGDRLLGAVYLGKVRLIDNVTI